MSLIPGKPPEDKNFGISSYYETAKEVGGDFIDFVQKPDGSYIVAIGDISGKGKSAALHMLQVSLMFRYISDTLNNPKTILTFLNKNIFAYIKKGLYLSMTIAEVKEKSLKVCRAGHMPLLYYKSEGKTVTEIKQSGMALGLNNSDLFSGSLQEYQLNADKNDILVFYSDGLTESMNTQNAEFGLERLKRIISETNQLLTWSISQHPNLQFALDPLQQLLKQLPHTGYQLTLHTDQGWHYQHRAWCKLLRQGNIRQCMSHRATCLDNAACETVFSILKAEIGPDTSYRNQEELSQAINEWIHFYNERRIQQN